MNNSQLKVKAMHDGSIEEILNGIKSNNTFELINAIIAGTRMNIKDNKFVDRLESAMKNEETLLGVPVYEFATASLDILGIKKYKGNNRRIKEMIQSELKF